jgi:hypothetical protein
VHTDRSLTCPLEYCRCSHPASGMVEAHHCVYLLPKQIQIQRGGVSDSSNANLIEPG